MTSLVFSLLVGHFVADFICQSDWMAVNKSKRWDALSWHVLAYSMVLGLVVAFSQPPSAYPYDTLKAFGLWWLVNAAAHFVQDAITSRLTSRLWFFRQRKGRYRELAFSPAIDYAEGSAVLTDPWVPGVGNRHWFFVAIGFDQLLHYVTLFVTADWWLR